MTGTMLVSAPDVTRRWEWDSDDARGVAEVKEEFDRLIERNFAYKTLPGGRLEQIREFDPTAEEIRVTAPLVGG